MGDTHTTTLSKILLLYVLPFAYGAATRVPFVFASLHVVLALRCSLLTLAGVLGCYQIFRVLGNFFVGAAGPDVALPLGAAAGLLGYGAMAAATAWLPTTVGPAAVAGCLAFVGLSEVITALQFFCKTTYSSDPVVLRSNLLRLYACNVSGTCVAFLLSAWLYHRHGITGSACLGMALEATLLLSSLVYLAAEGGQACMPPPSTQAAHNPHAHPFAAASRLRLPDDTTAAEAQAETGLGADPLVLQLSSSMSLHSPQMSRGGSLALSWGGSLRLGSLGSEHPSPFTHIPEVVAEEEEGGELLNGGGDTGGVPPHHSSSPPVSRRVSAISPRGSVARSGGSRSTVSAHRGTSGELLEGADDHVPWVNYLLAYTFCVQAALIGTILSTAPLLLHDALGLGVLHVGVSFAAGELLGSAALLSNSTPVGQALARRFLPLPLSLLWVLSGMGVTALALTLMARPYAALICVVIIMGLNDVGTSMTGECQGSSLPKRHFARLNTLGNVLRRFGNTVTCALGPCMYALHPRLPFVLFGVLTLSWVVLLTVMLALRARQLDHGHKVVPCRTVHSAVAAACVNVKLQDVHSGLQSYRDQSFVSKERAYWDRVDGAGKKAA